MLLLGLYWPTLPMMGAATWCSSSGGAMAAVSTTLCLCLVSHTNFSGLLWVLSSEHGSTKYSWRCLDISSPTLLCSEVAQSSRTCSTNTNVHLNNIYWLHWKWRTRRTIYNTQITTHAPTHNSTTHISPLNNRSMTVWIHFDNGWMLSEWIINLL